MPGCLSVSAADAPLQSHWSMPCQGIHLQLAHCTHKHGLTTAGPKLQCSTSRCPVGQCFAVPHSCCYLTLLSAMGCGSAEKTLCLQACTSAGGLGEMFESESVQGAIRCAGFQPLLVRAAGAGCFCAAQKLFVMCCLGPIFALPADKGWALRTALAHGACRNH